MQVTSLPSNRLCQPEMPPNELWHRHGLSINPTIGQCFVLHWQATMSDWEAFRLSKRQALYAAQDALVCGGILRGLVLLSRSAASAAPSPPQQPVASSSQLSPEQPMNHPVAAVQPSPAWRSLCAIKSAQFSSTQPDPSVETRFAQTDRLPLDADDRDHPTAVMQLARPCATVAQRQCLAQDAGKSSKQLRHATSIWWIRATERRVRANADP